MLAYLPTLLVIHQDRDSSHHSLLTWVTLAASNLVMAAWLYENNDCSVNRAILATFGNAFMCLSVCAVILYYR